MTDEDWRRYVLSHRSACAAEKEQQSAAELRAEVAHLEARRGALLAEVDRLTAALAAAREAVATARADGARDMRERAAGEIGRFFVIHGDQARERIRELPLPEGITPEQRSLADAERERDETASEVSRLQAAWARSEEAIALALINSQWKPIDK